MNYIKIRGNYINLNRINYFKTDSRDYYIAFYYDGGDVLVVTFDLRNEYQEALEMLELTIKEKGSLVK